MKANKRTENTDKGRNTRSFHKNFYYESEGSEFIAEKSNETDDASGMMSKFTDFDKARGYEKKF